MQVQMTLADYFGRPVRDTGQIKAQGKTLAGDSGRNRFHQVLAGLEKKNVQNADALQGMTLSDYRARPITLRSNTRSFQIEPGPETADDAAAGGQVESEKMPDSSFPVVDRPEKKNIDSQPAGTSAPFKTANAEAKFSINRQVIDGCISSAAAKYGLPEKLIHLVVEAESGYRPQAVSHAGARGLMQLMPETAADLGVSDPFDIRENIDGGARYLRQMMDRFDQDMELALAAYNAGPGNVSRYQGIPPFNETRRYVEKIMNGLEGSV